MAITPSYIINLMEGPYESGRILARFVQGDPFLNKHLADRVAWYDAYDKSLIDFERVQVYQDLTQKYLPTYFDEIRGFTDEVKLSYEKYLTYFMFDWNVGPFCSQFSVLPEITSDGKTSGANYTIFEHTPCTLVHNPE